MMFWVFGALALYFAIKSISLERKVSIRSAVVLLAIVVLVVLRYCDLL